MMFCNSCKLYWTDHYEDPIAKPVWYNTCPNCERNQWLLQELEIRKSKAEKGSQANNGSWADEYLGQMIAYQHAIEMVKKKQ